MSAPAKARLFVALDLPSRARAALARWARRELEAIDGLRLVPAAALHVTLCFLGWREEAALGTLSELVSSCAPSPSPRLGLGAPVWLPPRRPRVLAVDLDDREGTVATLQAHVSAALAAGAGYEPERRPFRPHVTVARVTRGARVGAVRAPSPPAQLAFAGEAVTLYRSRLGSGGARYEPVVRVALGPVDVG